MARTTGTFTFPSNFEVTKAAPLDARASTPLKSELTNGSLPFPYLGMLVAVTEDSTSNTGLYLLSAADATNVNSWIKVDSSGGGGGSGNGTVSGTGTANTIPMWASGYDLTDSKLAQTTKGIILSGGLNTEYIALSTSTGTFNLSANINGFIVGGNSTIQGNLSVLGDLVYLDTTVSVTSALSVVNHGTGPAIYAKQVGTDQPIAKFVDAEGGTVTIGDGGAVAADTLSATGNIVGKRYLSAGNDFSQLFSNCQGTVTTAGALLSGNATTIGVNSGALQYLNQSACPGIDCQGTVTTPGAGLSGTATTLGINAVTAAAFSCQGTVTNVTTGPYLTGGGTVTPEIGIDSACAAKWDASATGDISEVTTSSLLSGGGDSGSVEVGIDSGALQYLNQSACLGINKVGTVTSLSAGDGLLNNGTATDPNIAVNSTVIRTTGDQTIGGSKTFDAAAVFNQGLTSAVGGVNTIGLSATALNSGILSGGKDLNEIFQTIGSDVRSSVLSNGLGIQSLQYEGLSAQSVAVSQGILSAGSCINQGAFILSGAGGAGFGTTGAIMSAGVDISSLFVVGSGGGTAVTRISAGDNITISPINGIGNVTINASSAGGGGAIITSSLSSTGNITSSGSISAAGRVDGSNISTVETKVTALYSYLIENFDTNQITTATSLTDFVDNFSKAGLDPGDVITLSATNTAYILGDNDGSTNSDWLEVNLKPNFLFYRGNMSDYSTLDCVALSSAKSSKYIMQVEDNSDGAIFYGEINVVSDGTIAVATEYSLNHTTVFPFVEFGAEVISGRVCLSAVALESKNMANFTFKGNRSNLFG